MPDRFRPNYWGRLRQFQVPHGIVKLDTLVLGPSSLVLLLILLKIARGSQQRSRQPLVEVKVTSKYLSEHSGYSKNIITRALKDLCEKGFIKSCPERRRSGQFGASIYLICNPENSTPLSSTGRGSFLLANGIRYINIPACLISEPEARWSFANLAGSETQLYVSLCWVANKHSNNQFSTTAAVLTRLAGFATTPTTYKALKGLSEKGLISIETMRGQADISVHLLDPYTGEPLHDQTGDPEDDPANYYVQAATGRATEGKSEQPGC